MRACVHRVSIVFKIGSLDAPRVSERSTRRFIRQILALVYFHRQLKSTAGCRTWANKGLRRSHKGFLTRKKSENKTGLGFFFLDIMRPSVRLHRLGHPSYDGFVFMHVNIAISETAISP